MYPLLATTDAVSPVALALTGDPPGVIVGCDGGATAVTVTVLDDGCPARLVTRRL